MPVTTYTPAAADALFETFAGRALDDPKVYATTPNKRVTAKYFCKPLQDEVLNLIALALLGGTALKVRNETGGILTKGTLVYVSGYSAAQTRFLIAKADADSPATAAMLILIADLADVTNGLAYPFADATGIDTSGAAAVGSKAYLSATAGAFTFTAPTGADQIVQEVGVVTAKDAAAGAVRFYPGRSLVQAAGTTFLQANSVTLAKLAALAANTLIGSIAGGTPEAIACTAAGRALLDDASAAAQRATLGVICKNLLANGGFRVAQRGAGPFTSATAFPNNDDVYLLDQWNLLSDGADVVDVSQEATVVPTGARHAALFDVETANKQFGIVQFLEGRNAAALIGGTASLKFKARVSNTRIGTIRAAILSWTGAEDALTSDLVFAWNADADITPIDNWVIEGSAQFTMAAADTWYECKLENVAIDAAGAKNVAVFIWCDDETNNAGDFLYLAQVQLEVGAAATEFENIPFSADLARCLRYFWRLANPGGGGRCRFGFGMCTQSAATDIMGQHGTLPAPMRASPSLSYSALADWNIYDGAGLFVLSAFTITADDLSQYDLTATTAGATAAALRDCLYLISGAVGTEWAALSAEL